MPDDPSYWYVHKCITVNREEDVPPYSKPLKTAKKERVFKHETSVFQKWKPDTQATLDKIIEHDCGHWKASRFCKDPDELIRVQAVLKKHVKPLKEIYHALISASTYPGIAWPELIIWLQQVKIIDGVILDESRAEINYKAANFVIEAEDGNPENALNRY